MQLGTGMSAVVVPWVCVSEEFDAFDVTKALLEEITRGNDDSRSLNSRTCCQERDFYSFWTMSGTKTMLTGRSSEFHSTTGHKTA
ncbi:hypothetical protein V6N13_080518 [Hibiscus sabdariffa]